MDASSSAQSVLHEIELKLELDPADAELLRDHGLLRDSAPRAQDQLTVYYDTPDEALKVHGFTLRVRSAAGGFVQTVKPVSDAACLVARAEIEYPVDSIAPDLGRLANSPLAALAGAGALASLAATFRSQVHRTSWTIEFGGSQLQVDFDEGEIAAGGRSQKFVELEVELVSGEPACLFAAARAIADRVPVRLGVLTKAERGARLAAGAHKKIAKAAPVKVDRAMSVAEAFEIMVHACLKHYRLNEPLVIDRRKPEALHQTRVAMRRLRSAFTLFKSAIRDVEYDFLREELRWFTGQLGDARNLDVYLQRELPPADRATLLERRETAYDHLIGVMNSRRFRGLMLELVGWTAFGPWRSGKQARKPVEGYASDRLDRLWNSIAHTGHHLADLDEETRHELRIQVKKMRYAIEFLRGLYPAAGPAEKRFADAVEELQESLGNLNDLATARLLAGGAPATDEWLIGAPEEKLHLREAERAFREVAAVGPFWRRTGAAVPQLA